MARLALALVVASALLAAAFSFMPPQQAPRRATTSPSATSASSEASRTHAIKPFPVGKALARALAAPALLLTAMLAPSPMMPDGGAAWAISGGGKDWVRVR
jgi:hypothetical protein